MKFSKMPRLYGSTTVGERGQIVLPAEAREKFGIKAGEKLLVMGDEMGGFQKIVLMKNEAVAGLLKHLLNMEKFVKDGGVKEIETALKKEMNKK